MQVAKTNAGTDEKHEFNKYSGLISSVYGGKRYGGSHFHKAACRTIFDWNQNEIKESRC